MLELGLALGALLIGVVIGYEMRRSEEEDGR